MKLDRQTKRSMKRVAAGALVFAAAAALVSFGYTTGLALGKDEALVAMLACVAVAAALVAMLCSLGGDKSQ